MGKAIGTIVGGIIGNNKAKGAQAESGVYAQDALNAIKNIKVPEIAEQQRNYLLKQLEGEFTPEMLQAIEQGPSAFEDIEIDPRLKQAQMDALEYYSQVGEMGLTPSERSARNEIMRSQANQSAADRATALANAAQRGVAGSGIEMAAQLAGAQGAAERASQASDELVSEAFKRSLDAQSNKATLANSMRTQDYNEAERLAQARDQIARVNAQQQIDTQSSNIGARNQAQAKNLAERQRIADENILTKNQQQDVNKQLFQTKFNNEFDKGTAASGAYRTRAQDKASEAAGIRARDTQMGQSVGGIGDSVVKAIIGSDVRLKKDIKNASGQIRQLLDKLDAYQYEYKDNKGLPEGERVGIMAQDLERAGPIGEAMVKDTPEGKMVDYGQSMGTVFAALAELNKRLNNIEGK